MERARIRNRDASCEPEAADRVRRRLELRLSQGRNRPYGDLPQVRCGRLRVLRATMRLARGQGLERPCAALCGVRPQRGGMSTGLGPAAFGTGIVTTFDALMATRRSGEP